MKRLECRVSCGPTRVRAWWHVREVAVLLGRLRSGGCVRLGAVFIKPSPLPPRPRSATERDAASEQQQHSRHAAAAASYLLCIGRQDLQARRLSWSACDGQWTLLGLGARAVSMEGRACHLRRRACPGAAGIGPTICETKELQHKYYYDREASPSGFAGTHILMVGMRWPPESGFGGAASLDQGSLGPQINWANLKHGRTLF